MKLKVIRFSSQKDSTSGLLFDVTDGTKFLARDDSDAELYRQKVGDKS